MVQPYAGAISHGNFRARRMRLDRCPCISFVAFAMLCMILLVGCAEKEKISLNIPEGYATNTLKEFARQAKVEILFDLQTVNGVKTNAISGKYYPVSALRMMLGDTLLVVDFESETGAYAVYRAKS